MPNWHCALCTAFAACTGLRLGLLQTSTWACAIARLAIAAFTMLFVVVVVVVVAIVL